jgi:uncharacterized OB-fold protein
MSAMSEVVTQPQRMIDEQLATVGADGAVQLWGSRCGHCGNVSFPQQSSCPRCTREGAERYALPGEGLLWSWTIQGFPPKSPPYAGSAETFQPYGVGYVELGGEVRVEGILTTADPGELEMDMAMRVVAIPVPGREQDGIVTFAFAPSVASS